MKSSSQFRKIMLYLPPADMRKQVMGLAEMVETILEEDPFEGCLYLFCNISFGERAQRIKTHLHKLLFQVSR